MTLPTDTREKAALLQQMRLDLGQRLARARKDAGWAKEALADKIGVCRNTLTAWEASHSEPTPSMIVLLAHLWGVPAIWLLPAYPGPTGGES